MADDPSPPDLAGSSRPDGGVVSGATPEDPAALRAQVAELSDRVDALADRVDATAATAPGDDGAGSMTIVATKGTLDMAYPPLILATTAAAFDWDVTIFFTFWGLDLLHREKADALKLSAVGNPNLEVPNALAALPGMDAMASWLLQRRIEANGVASVRELLDLALESGVTLQGCQMTMDLLGYEADDLLDDVEAGVGAATAFEHLAEADVQLLV